MENRDFALNEYHNEQRRLTKKMFKKGVLIGTLVTFMLFASVFGMYAAHNFLFGPYVPPAITYNSADEEYQGKLQEIYHILRENFLFADEIDENALIDGVFTGFVDSLGDPFTSYFNVEDTLRHRESRMGAYYGIGAVLTFNEDVGGAEIIRLFEESPAEEVGLLVGDIIVQVNETEITDQDLTEIVSWIRGEKGTYVNLTVLRDTDRISFDVMRDNIQVASVAHEMLGRSIGYMSISGFDHLTFEQFYNAMDDLESQGMEGLIIDLRDNPGGSLHIVVDILNEIVPEGIIVTMEDRNGNVIEHVSDGENDFDLPLVVLVNENSASASEIFAGAIRDHDMGTIVGTTTYGKGLVQRIIDLSDGSSLQVTIAEYFTPNGTSINETGIVPDIEIELDEPEYIDNIDDIVDNQLEMAIEVMRGKIRR